MIVKELDRLGETFLLVGARIDIERGEAGGAPTDGTVHPAGTASGRHQLAFSDVGSVVLFVVMRQAEVVADFVDQNSVVRAADNRHDSTFVVIRWGDVGGVEDVLVRVIGPHQKVAGGGVYIEEKGESVSRVGGFHHVFEGSHMRKFLGHLRDRPQFSCRIGKTFLVGVGHGDGLAFQSLHGEGS